MIEVRKGRDAGFSGFEGNVNRSSIFHAQGRKTVDKNSRGRKDQEKGVEGSESTHFEIMFE
jgi:hypothetical protein